MSAATTAPRSPTAQPPRASGGLPWLGHLLERRRSPIDLMQRVHDPCGEVGEARALRPLVDAALTYCPAMALRTAALRAAALPNATANDHDLNLEKQGDE